jgi:hypothetical protein
MRPQQVPTTPDLLAVRERRQSLRSAMGAFEGALAGPALGRIPEWTAGLVTALQQLDTRVTEHIAATEGPTGFHGELVAASPRLVHSVSLLVAEHHRICELLDQLRRATNHARTDGQVGGIREQGTQTLALLAKHRQRGADLIYEAYERDLGAGD